MYTMPTVLCTHAFLHIVVYLHCFKNPGSLVLVTFKSSNYVLESHREKEKLEQFQWQIQIKELKNTRIKSGWTIFFSPSGIMYRERTMYLILQHVYSVLLARRHSLRSITSCPKVPNLEILGAQSFSYHRIVICY